MTDATIRIRHETDTDEVTYEIDPNEFEDLAHAVGHTSQKAMEELGGNVIPAPYVNGERYPLTHTDAARIESDWEAHKF